MTTITMTSDYMQSNKARVIPGAYWDRDSRSWLLAAPTPRAALITLKLFPALQFTYPELVQVRDTFAQDVRPVDYAADFPDPTALAPEVQRALAADGKHFWPFQARDIAFHAAVLERHGSSYLGWERGLGKTLGAIALIEATCSKRVLIVATNTSKRTVWEPEWERWGAGLGLPFNVLPNPKAHREAAVAWMYDVRDAPLVMVVHFEALKLIAATRASYNGWKRLGLWDLVIVDEAHHLANKNSLQTRMLKRIPTKRRLALSGSIIQNHAGELYSPLNWLWGEGYQRDTDRQAVDQRDQQPLARIGLEPQDRTLDLFDHVDSDLTLD